MTKQWRIIDVITWGTEYLKQREIESARLQIELLICNTLSLKRIELYLYHDKPLSANELTTIKEALSRIIKHEPLQYIFGTAEFYECSFNVNPNVLIPRPETELLVEASLKALALIASPIDIIDIGTGSGCIAISIAQKYPQVQTYGIDISYEALRTAKENASLNDTNVKFKQMDILTEIPQKTFTAVISNPPYINITEYDMLDQNVKDYEPALALTDNSDGLIFYRRYAEIFPQIISPEGFFAIEIGHNQSDDVAELFKEHFELKIIKDYANIDRIIVGTFK